MQPKPNHEDKEINKKIIIWKVYTVRNFDVEREEILFVIFVSKK